MKKNKNINKGAALLAVMFMLLFFVLFARFVYIQTAQTVEGRDLLTLARKQWLTKESLDARRGTIYGRNGEVLAQDVQAYTLYAVLDKDAPSHVKNVEKTAAALAPLLGMPEKRIEQLLRRDVYQVEFGTYGDQLSYRKKEKIAALDLPGIHFRQEVQRFYPNQTFASYVLGYTSIQNGKQIGMMGVEESFNDVLSGKDGHLAYYEGQFSTKLPGEEKKFVPPQHGNDIYLTIDGHIQAFLERAVERVWKKYDPHRIMAIVADPETGEILAMSNRPSFNPNIRNIVNYTNQAISAPFEPGSTMKMFTLAAAVNEGVWPGEKTYKSGRYEIAGDYIHDYHDGGWGRITFNEGLRRSSNVAFSIVAKEYLGFDRFFRYLEQFGFTEKTGIALPNEADSMISYEWPLEKAATAFGQGTAVTAIQLVQAATAIANDGKMMQPQIIEKVVNPNTREVVKKKEPRIVGTPISPATAEKVRRLLGTVVSSPDGTGQEYAIEGYDVAGKTGTAQIAVNGGYLEDEFLHSFLGMAPQNDPQLLVYVAVDRPELENKSQSPVAEIFVPVMKKSLQYLKIKPDVTSLRHYSVSLRNYQGKPVANVVEMLKEKGLRPVVLGSGETVVAQLPHAGISVLRGERVMLRTNGTATMPDLTGWSFADVMKLADLLNLKVDIAGMGFVTSQSIDAGVQVYESQRLHVRLEPHR